MVRILHVIDSLDLGGAQTALLNLLRYADRSRFHHEVATMHGQGMFWTAFSTMGIPVHSLSPKRWPPTYVSNLLALLGRDPFDIVHCHLFASNWIAKPLAALRGARILYNHDQCNDAFRSRNPAAILIDASTNVLSTRILAVSKTIERFLLDVEGIDSEKVTYLPNSVDAAEFRPPGEYEKQAARRQFGLDPEAFVVAGVGRLTAQKNFTAFVQAGSELHRRFPSVTFALFGSGPEESRLKSLAEPMGSRFRFLGTVTDRPSIFAAIDVFVLPSLYEGLPMTLLESMAAGVPAVASAVDGVLEIVTPGIDAWLCVPGDTRSLAASIEDAIGNSARRAQFSTNARGRVLHAFESRKLAAKLGSLYIQDWEAAR